MKADDLKIKICNRHRSWRIGCWPIKSEEDRQYPWPFTIIISIFQPGELETVEVELWYDGRCYLASQPEIPNKNICSNTMAKIAWGHDVIAIRDAVLEKWDALKAIADFE